MATKQLKKTQQAKLALQPTYMLLVPLNPEFFGYTTGEVTRMVNELALVGISTIMTDTGKGILLYARASQKETLEQLCTAYDLGGLLVEVTAVYDQVIIPEFV